MRAVVQPGNVVVDIGANIGLHTALLADLVGPAGHVHAFEPNGDLLHSLGQTARRAGNVTVHGVGLGDKTEVRDFYIPEDLAMASLADWTEGRAGDVHVGTCEVRVLDDLIRNGSLVALPDFHRDCDHYNLLAVPAARLGAVRSISSVGAARTESENMRRAINP